MIRQQLHQQTLAQSAMLDPDELVLTCRAKPAVIRPGGHGFRPLSKNNRLSLTPGLHLSAAPGQEALVHLKSSPSPLPSSSSSSSFALPTCGEICASPQCPESQREVENLPPRRPLKLTPLELPLEVTEAQWQKTPRVQQVVKSGPRKLDVAADDEPCEPGARKVKSQGSATSPVRFPLSTIANPTKRQNKAGKVLLLPVTHLQLDDDRSTGKEARRKDASPTLGAKPAPPSAFKTPSVRPAQKANRMGDQSERAERTSDRTVHAERTLNQLMWAKQEPDQLTHAESMSNQLPWAQRTPDRSAGAETTIERWARAEADVAQSAAAELASQEAGRRRPRLRRAQRLEEDQSKSGSSAGGLSADEGKPGAGGHGGWHLEKCGRKEAAILRDANLVLEKAVNRNLQAGGRLFLSGIKQH